MKKKLRMNANERELGKPTPLNSTDLEPILMLRNSATL